MRRPDPHRAVLRVVSLFLLALAPWAVNGQDETAPPPATIDGVPALAVTIIDNVSDSDARRAPFRERLLRDAFEDAIKQSGLRYAYSLSFHSRKIEEGIPELELEIREWTYSGTGVFECTIHGVYISGDGTRHDLKATVGVESTISMSGAPVDVEDHLESSARKGMATLLGRVKKKRLYPL